MCIYIYIYICKTRIYHHYEIPSRPPARRRRRASDPRPPGRRPMAASGRGLFSMFACIVYTHVYTYIYIYMYIYVYIYIYIYICIHIYIYNYICMCINIYIYIYRPPAAAGRPASRGRRGSRSDRGRPCPAAGGQAGRRGPTTKVLVLHGSSRRRTSSRAGGRAQRAGRPEKTTHGAVQNGAKWSNPMWRIALLSSGAALHRDAIRLMPYSISENDFDTTWPNIVIRRHTLPWRAIPYNAQGEA